jgi:hypothetical protein
MATTYQRRKVVGNPGRRTAAKKKKYHARRTNPGEILGFTLGNPGRRRATMAKKHKKASRGSKSHKSNPARHHSKKYVARRHRSNVGGMAGLTPMVTNAVFVIVGALGSKLATQAVLGPNNVGLVGYAGNAAAGGLLWFLTSKVMKNPAASSGVIAGTIVQIVLRIIHDYTPFGQYVAQLGMGDYQMQSFVTPQVLVDPWKSADIQIPDGWAPRTVIQAPVAAAAGGGMGSLYGGGGYSNLYGV